MTGGVIELALGLGLLAVGGEIFVSGALRMGRFLRVGSWATGATLVAFRTSTPELAVNWVAAAEGHTELAFGNVIGSNIANVGLVLAVAATVRAIPLGRHRFERGLLLLTIVAVFGLAVDESLRGASARIGWPEACVLLVGFSLLLDTSSKAGLAEDSARSGIRLASRQPASGGPGAAGRGRRRGCHRSLVRPGRSTRSHWTLGDRRRHELARALHIARRPPPRRGRTDPGHDPRLEPLQSPLGAEHDRSDSADPDS